MTIIAWNKRYFNLFAVLRCLALTCVTCWICLAFWAPLIVPLTPAHAAQDMPTPPKSTAQKPPNDAPVIVLNVKKGATIEMSWDMATPSPIWVETAPGVFQQAETAKHSGGYMQVRAYGTELNIYGPITWFNCSKHGDQLTALDVSKNPALQELYCVSNALTSLDVSKNTALTRLECSGNGLTALDVSKNTALTQLSCVENQLTALDLSKNPKLEYLSCASNKLTSLTLSKDAALKSLIYAENPLTEAGIQRR